MAVYMILEADVHDPEAYEKYKQAAPQYVARHGGEYCVRGGESTVFGGDWQPGRVVMLNFPAGRPMTPSWTIPTIVPGEKSARP